MDGFGVQRLDCGSRGSIVNVASISSWIAQPEFVPYNVSKGAVAQLTRCCAMDFTDERVRVNAVGPVSGFTHLFYHTHSRTCTVRPMLMLNSIKELHFDCGW